MPEFPDDEPLDVPSASEMIDSERLKKLGADIEVDERHVPVDLSVDFTDNRGRGEHLAFLGGLAIGGLTLAETRTTDAGLAHLVGLSTLELLSLARTKVTDEGLRHPAGLGAVRRGRSRSVCRVEHADGFSTHPKGIRTR